MPKQLRGLSVREVSGVDAAANKRKFLLAKAAKPDPTNTKGANNMAKQNALAAMIAKALAPLKLKKALTPEQIAELIDAAGGEADDTTPPELVDYVDDQESDDQLDDLCCALGDALDDVLDSETTEDKREAVNALLEQFSEALGAGGLLKAAGVLKAGRKISSSNLSTLTQIQTLLGTLIASAQGDGTDPAPDADTGTADDGADDEDVQMAREVAKDKRAAKKAEREKAKKGKKEEKDMAKSAEFVSLEKRLAASENEVKKERDIRLNAEFLQKAKSIGPVPGITFEKSAALLKSLSETNPEQAKQVEEQMKASAAIARQSPLFKEQGFGGEGGTTNPEALMVAKAQEIAKRDNIGFADALTKAAKEDPSLNAQYINQSRKGA